MRSWSLALLIGLFSYLQTPALSLAADSPAFGSPAAVISAAEDAYGKEDFKAFADCFDAAGQKQMNVTSIQMLAVFAGLDGDAGKSAKALFAKYGVTDLSQKAGESDDAFANRIAGQLKDPRGFMVEAIPLVTPNPDHKKPTKGNLGNLKIDGKKAKATYVVTPAGTRTGYTMTQDMTFVQTGGSWKISSPMIFASTVG